jgi:predicted RNA-binding Zn-ribbon protein involved in translation (DUF1610 family)
MTQPAFEVADIIRVKEARFLERYGSGLDFQQLKALHAIRRCRTSALGGHIDVCPKCGHEANSFNSCRNRSCPKCQARSRRRWIANRERDLLPTSYFHVVFTVPHELIPLALENQRLFYSLLFSASSKTALKVAANPKRLGAEIGILSILHTWGQNLQIHPHIHCVIPEGGIAPDHKRWIHSRYRFFLPVKVLSRVFRGKFLAGLKRLYEQKKLQCVGPAAAFQDPEQFAGLLRRLYKQKWFVYAKPAFGGPMQVIRYLGRYTHRVAVSNHRLLDFDGEKVTFLWKDYAHASKQGKMTLDALEFLRRFFLHVLPKGFVRIRSFGFLANRFRAERLALCRELLAGEAPAVELKAADPLPEPSAWLCPHCGTTMVIVYRFTAAQWSSRGNFIDN